MRVGAHTPYPGLVTKIDDAHGKITNIATGRSFMLRLSQRGMWIGTLIHSDSHGSDHLAVELPFSLYDESGEKLVAQSQLLGRIDLSNRAEPFVPILRFSPTESRDLRQQTADIGRAINGHATPGAQPSRARTDQYRAALGASRLWGVAGREQFGDLFTLESLAMYGSDSNELMQLELESPGFTRSDRVSTERFTLRLSYAPDLIDVHGRVAYLYPLAGQIAFHSANGDRLVEIGPGNHGHVASKAYLTQDALTLDLGVALKDGLGQPALARLVLKCPVGESRCTNLTLTTAMDPDGRIVTSRAVSSVLEGRSSSAVMSDVTH
jgi:hypothetical protein